MDSFRHSTDSKNQKAPDATQNANGGQEEAKNPGSKVQGRKRTKTGCLTCRRRRIKCGEERPTCQNCQKSKRQCEGYVQRVVFKDPLNSYRPSFSGTLHTPYAGSNHGLSLHSYSGGSQQLQPTTTSISIAPKSSQIPSFVGTTNAQSPVFSPATQQSVCSLPDSISNLQSPTSSLAIDLNQRQDESTDSVDHSHVPGPTDGLFFQTYGAGQNRITHSPWLPEFNNSPRQLTQETPQQTRKKPQEMARAHTPSFHVVSSHNRSPTGARIEVALVPSSSSVAKVWPDSNDFKIKTADEAPSDYGQRHEGKVNANSSGVPGAIYGQETSFDRTQAPPTDAEDDELYDASDDNISIDEYGNSAAWIGNTQENHLRRNNLGAVVAFQAQQDTHNLTLRSFTSFIDRPDMLATYIPSAQSSPLRDRMTARIFCHFVNVTGPSISMFERHPANPALIFQGKPVSKSQQHIWTYTFPTLALQDSGLLHSMLAVASLHIARLQNGPVTASLKHYALGLRRVAKSVSLPHRRRQPATLAAAMLLAFYECWSADHQKWSNHLLGARLLVRETDFLGMTRRIKAMKRQQRKEEQSLQLLGGPVGNIDKHGSSYSASEDVDEATISMLMGKRLRYDEYGRVVDENISEFEDGNEITDKDIEVYQTLRDLFWWYCKQDAYQSILGGGRLFMEYSLWSHCPPRSAIGQLNATYGTYDHLILLMGRLADFAARDLGRKRLALQKNGGWRPLPGMSTGPPSNANNRRQPPRAAQQPRTQMPAFSGMVPVTGEAQLPMGFSPIKEESPQSANVQDKVDLEVQGKEAGEEWQEIRDAFGLLESHFSEEFRPLGPEFSPPVRTPFGLAQQYRTYGIAGIWMNYYMGLIACYRSHPSMPPAAMMAAGVAASQTAFFANELGRIAAGIAPDCNLAAHVSPGVGAALIESATCLFVAGVQYQDSVQRIWTVQRLQDIARLTGWQTASAIAAGCEKTWVKAAELGKGPNYTRIEVTEKIPDLWSPSRRIDRAFYGMSNDERKMIIQRPDRVQYALGLLGVQEDFEDLNLDDETAKREK